jgi:hypothetical protein
MNPLSGNPFFGDGASVEQYRDTRPPAVDPYRDFFVGKVTAVTNSGGTNYYAWTEQTINPATGLPQDANPGREGTATNSPAVEVNNVALTTFPVYVFMRSKGFLNGAPCYEFEYAPPGGSSSVSSWKSPVRVATTTAGTLGTSFENGDTVDDVTLATGDRILIKNQATASENGIYTVNASGAPTRATDADTGAELLGATAVVTEGTANADTVWLCTANATITVGSTNLPWALAGRYASGAQTYTATSVSSDTTWTDLGSGVSLPAGTYLLMASASANGRATSGFGASVQARFYNDTDAAAVPFSTAVVTWQQVISISPVALGGTAGIVVRVTLSGTKTIKLQGWRSSATWDFVTFASTDLGASQQWSYLRVA